MNRAKHSSRPASVKISYSFLRILTGADLSLRRLPLMSARSSRPGPVVWLTACGHGDEVCGMVIIQEVFKLIRRKLKCGSIYAFPLMNPLGFETASRQISVSREDLNRSFPGDKTGSLGKRLAGTIFSAIMDTSPDLVLDLHNDWIKSIPYVLLDNPSTDFPRDVYEQARAFAQQTGFAVIVDSEKLTSTLSCNLILKKVPALTLELGESYVINERNVEYGLNAILNILEGLNMVDAAGAAFLYPLPEDCRPGNLLYYSERPYSSQSGIIRFLAKAGERVKAGQPFARVVNAFGKNLETVRAKEEGVVLGHTDSSVVFPGMPIMAFGVKRRGPE